MTQVQALCLHLRQGEAPDCTLHGTAATGELTVGCCPSPVEEIPEIEMMVVSGTCVQGGDKKK